MTGHAPTWGNADLPPTPSRADSTGDNPQHRQRPRFSWPGAWFGTDLAALTGCTSRLCAHRSTGHPLVLLMAAACACAGVGHGADAGEPSSRDRAPDGQPRQRHAERIHSRRLASPDRVPIGRPMLVYFLTRVSEDGSRAHQVREPPIAVQPGLPRPYTSRPAAFPSVGRRGGPERPAALPPERSAGPRSPT